MSNQWASFFLTNGMLDQWDVWPMSNFLTNGMLDFIDMEPKRQFLHSLFERNTRVVMDATIVYPPLNIGYCIQQMQAAAHFTVIPQFMSLILSLHPWEQGIRFFCIALIEQRWEQFWETEKIILLVVILSCCIQMQLICMRGCHPSDMGNLLFIASPSMWVIQSELCQYIYVKKFVLQKKMFSFLWQFCISSGKKAKQSEKLGTLYIHHFQRHNIESNISLNWQG